MLLAAAGPGPHGNAFGALSGKCVHADASEYTYDICFYDKGATQKPRRGGSSFSLGRHWAWDKRHVVGGVSGLFSGGDHCATAGARSLRVQFVCAPGEERLGHMQEVQTCQYEIRLETSAAC